MPRSARQQNEQARPVPNREDRSIVKLKILLQRLVSPSDPRACLPNSGRPSGLPHRACDNCAATMLKFCTQMEGDWFLSRCSRTAGFRRRHLAQHERLDRTPRVQARKRARTRTNSYVHHKRWTSGRVSGEGILLVRLARRLLKLSACADDDLCLR